MMRLVLALLVLCGCRSADHPIAVVSSSATDTVAVGPVGPPPDPRTIRVPAAGSCHVVNGLPDHVCTPGSLNPMLTVAQLCAATFRTSTIRPPESYTNALKLRLMDSYGYTGQSTAGFELDHLVSLEDGGHPWAVENLWPEPRNGNLNAGEKDKVENAVKKEICAQPAGAQRLQLQLAINWTVFRHSAVIQEPTVEPEP